jgi:hypothetical protein
METTFPKFLRNFVYLWNIKLKGKKLKEPIIHKQGKETVERYIGFGVYEKVKAPICAGAKGLWSGKSYYTHRLWKYVTCKKCLNFKGEGNEKIYNM